jgi:heat-inducible transcriptional repressor
MQLSQRKHEILCAAIDDYIKDACPITSSNVQQKQTLKLSTATLRNELNALEEMGFLKQIHTSGGRIPTAEGYKYYVNNLMQNIQVDEQQLTIVREHLSKRTQSLSEIATELATIISRATNYPAAVVVSGIDKLVVQNVTVVPLLQKKALVLIQTESGYLNNTIDTEADKKTCEDASSYLTKLFVGKTIGFLVQNMDMIREGIAKHMQSFCSILDCVIEQLRTIIQKPVVDISHEFSKDFALSNKAEDMQKMLALLADESKLTTTLENPSGELFVELDKEDENLAGLVLVRAPIVLDGKQVASVGVFGPQRMNYSAITAALKLVAEELKGGENVISEKDN